MKCSPLSRPKGASVKGVSGPDGCWNGGSPQGDWSSSNRPRRDLRRMHLVGRRQLVDRPLSPNRLQGHPCLQRRAVTLPLTHPLASDALARPARLSWCLVLIPGSPIREMPWTARTRKHCWRNGLGKQNSCVVSRRRVQRRADAHETDKWCKKFFSLERLRAARAWLLWPFPSLRGPVVAMKPGGTAPVLAKHLRALEKENRHLKKLAADQALDIQIRKKAARPNWPVPSDAVRSPRSSRRGPRRRR